MKPKMKIFYCSYLFFLLGLVLNNSLYAQSYESVGFNKEVSEEYKQVILDTQADKIKEGQKYITPEIKEKINRDNNELQNAIIETNKSMPQDNRSPDNEYSGKRLFVFVSSSMPIEIIRNYIMLTDNVKDETIFLINGFVDGIEKFKPTFEWLIKVLCDDAPAGSSECLNASIDINPNLFNEFDVTVVPSVLYLPKGVGPCSCEEKYNYPEKPFYLSRGDAPVQYHLSKMLETENNHKFELSEFKAKLKNEIKEPK